MSVGIIINQQSMKVMSFYLMNNSLENVVNAINMNY